MKKKRFSNRFLYNLPVKKKEHCINERMAKLAYKEEPYTIDFRCYRAA